MNPIQDQSSNESSVRVIHGADEIRRILLNRSTGLVEIDEEAAGISSRVFHESLTPEAFVDRVIRTVEAEGDMGHAGSAIAECDNVLTPLDVFTSRQVEHHHLVERWHGLEVKAVQSFNGGELSQPDPPLNLTHVDLFRRGKIRDVPLNRKRYPGSGRCRQLPQSQSGRARQMP